MVCTIHFTGANAVYLIKFPPRDTMAGLFGISSKQLSSWKQVIGLVKFLQNKQRVVQSGRNYSVALTSVGIEDQPKLCRGFQLREIHSTRSMADDHGKFSLALERTAATFFGH